MDVCCRIPARRVLTSTLLSPAENFLGVSSLLELESVELIEDLSTSGASTLRPSAKESGSKSRPAGSLIITCGMAAMISFSSACGHSLVTASYLSFEMFTSCFSEIIWPVTSGTVVWPSCNSRKKRPALILIPPRLYFVDVHQMFRDFPFDIIDRFFLLCVLFHFK